MHGAAAHSEALFLFQIVLLVVVGRLFGELMVRIGQPSIMGQIIGGILLGPSVLGYFAPGVEAAIFPQVDAQKSMTEAVAQLGILFLLLLAGMETDLGLAMRLRRSAASISLAGIVVPFTCGFVLGELMPQHLVPNPDQRIVTSLFMGTALAISSVKIVATVVREMDFLRRNIGQLIVASAIIDDTIGWVVIAFTFSLAKSGTIDLASIGTSVFGTLVFMVVSFTIGRRLVFEIIRLTNDNFKSDLPVLSAIIAIMGAMAMLTDMIGVHTVLGAFVAGILVGESPILTRQIDTQLRGLTTALFMPVFFGLTGLKTDIGVLFERDALLLTLGLIVVASIGKFGGAFVGARLSGLSRAEALALGSGMNARGSTEVIIATIGLSVGVLNEQLFSAIVAMALVTTMAMPATLRWALRRLPLREEEENRLLKEDFEAASFLNRFERPLLTVDLSTGGDLAGRLAANFALARATPLTILNVEESEDKTSAPENTEDNKTSDFREKTEAFATRLRERSVRPKEEGDESAKADGIHVTARHRDGAEVTDVLKDSAEKGHDLLFVGVDPVSAESGGFSRRVSRLVAGFASTVAIVVSREGRTPVSDNELRILIPITDTERSIRAVEFGCALARPSGGAVSVIYILEPNEAQQRPRFGREESGHAAAFERIDEISAQTGVKITKTLQEGSSAEVAVLRHARRGRYNLLIVGVSRRAGERLSYGRIADTLLDTSDRSIVFVETEQA
ncbi:Kef-type K+ transport system membrane component KefB/nucleotide-binding universal stress UspA family protein [Rhizobium aquaticum]|uniref:Kef-type K+ transport system membrane component KefB/nucleotide-binding universal stress UspA family protein n=1 Tax=Rhizobium aquaticum TaxID=1549636 RepID=A0ABV2J4Q3_9HYPH